MRACVTAVGVVAIWFSSSTATAAGPFRDLSFEKACKAARERDKIVLVDFYTTWCGPCKLLDQTTWKDRKVERWLRNNAIALKVDAEKERRLAKKYSIDAYPTILLLKPDGTEIDRLVGYREAEVFLAESRDALAGKDSLARAKEKIEGDKKNDPSARMNYARTLQQKGKREEALREYLWCFDHGNEHQPSFVGVRLSFLLDDMVRLGQSYPPAIEALKDRRDAAEETVLASVNETKGGAKERTERRKRGLLSFLGVRQPNLVADRAMEFAAINRTLGDNERTLALYDKLLEKGESTRQLRTVMFHDIVDLLLEAKRYDDLLAQGDGAFEEVAKKIANYEMNAAMFKDSKHDLGDFMKASVGADGGKYYEALLGVGLKDEARRLANKLIAFDKSGRTYATLIEHAVRTEAYAETHRLVRRAEISLPDEELPKVRQAADRIPDGNRLRRAGQPND